jgi:CRP-like cAMP-binding protein
MDLELIKKAEIFAALDQEELAAIAEISTLQTKKSAEKIFSEGEPGNRLYIISDGEVRISRQMPGSGEEALTILKPGACFGEMAVFDRFERSTDAIAHTDCTLITLSRADFEMLLDFNRELAYKILWAMVRLLCNRLRTANENLKSFLSMSMF